MPIYTYRCKTCKTTTEVKQSITEAPLTHCLKCNGEANRIITNSLSIQFKGSGFYCTDSK